jgi:hypothetical protein
MTVATDIANLKKRMASAEQTLINIVAKNKLRDGRIDAVTTEVESAHARISAVETRMAKLEEEMALCPFRTSGEDDTELTEVENLYLYGAGDSNQTFAYKLFTGVADPYTTDEWSGTVLIGSGVHDVTFNYCTFDTCSTAGYNTFKAITEGGTIERITFNHCLFKSAGRMACEINERESGHIGDFTFTYCTFEPSASETFSCDGETTDGPLTVSHCVFGGGGLPVSGGNRDWPQNIEFADWSDITCTNSIFYKTGQNPSSPYNGNNWNLRGDASGWVINDNFVYGDTEFTDALAAAAGCPHGSDFGSGSGLTPDSEVLCATNLSGGDWSNNYFYVPDYIGASYMSSCSNIDFDGSTWAGPGANNHAESGCSGISYT